MFAVSREHFALKEALMTNSLFYFRSYRWRINIFYFLSIKNKKTPIPTRIVPDIPKISTNIVLKKCGMSPLTKSSGVILFSVLFFMESKVWQKLMIKKRGHV